MATAQNGWPIVPDTTAGRRRLADLQLPGTMPHPVRVLAGDVATIARWHVAEYHRRVEPIKPAGCWGWNVRLIGDGPDWSNHAAACAWDLNAPDNPDGVPTRKVMTPQQIHECHKLERESGGVLRWGGDWSDPDAMHWEIVGTPAQAAVFAEKIRNEEDDTVSKQDVIDALASDAGAEALAHSIKTTPALREALAWAILAYDPGADSAGKTPNGAVVNMTNPTPTNPTVGPATALERAQVAAVVGYQIRDRVDAVTGLVRALAALAASEAAEDDTETADLRARLDAALAAVDAVPTRTLQALADEGLSDGEVAAALRAALGDRARPVGQLLAA